MFAEERLRHITDLVRQQGNATVGELSKALGVSSVTIRRDLERLEEQKLVLRTHGGAITLDGKWKETLQEKSFSEKEPEFAGEKERIAEAAAELVAEREGVLLTPGTTNTLLIRKLAGKQQLTLVTNATNIATLAGAQQNWDVLLTGGKLRPESYALVGPLAEQSLMKLRVDKLFLGVDGFDFSEGLTTPNLAEAAINRKMISIAKQVIVVADHSKFRRVLFAHIASLDVIHTVITDKQLPRADAQRIKERGIQLILV